MKRFPLMVASGAIGLALLAGVTHKLTASTSAAAEYPPGDNVGCYYHLWTCSYDGNAYWDGCDPNYGEGWVPTSFARSICTTYHSQ